MDLHFNLVDEPWLPCIRTDGEPVEMGLYDTLAQAHTLRELHGETPLGTAALHRLLLVVLHRIFGPENREAWSQLWRKGRWDEVALGNYFDRWRHRFDLFDDEHPFFQATDERVKPKSVTSLMFRVASGNNPTLFDHHTDAEGITLTPAQAARALVAAQSFGLAGLSGLQQKFTDGSCARGVVFLVQGKTFFQTLALNLVRYKGDVPIPRQPDDCPAWEKDNPFTPERSIPLGYLDYLTWQNRRVLLLPEDTPSGPVVRQMTMAPALRLDDAVLNPMTHYRRDEKRGPMPLAFREGRALWRDSAALFQLHDEGRQPPQAFRWLSGLVEQRYLPESAIYRYLALGMSKKQAKVYFFRHERMPLPLTYLADETLSEKLRDALRAAEGVGTALRRAGWELAQWIVSPANRKKAHRDNTQLVFSQLNVERRYWSRLEVPFQSFVCDLPRDRRAALDDWIKTLQQTARHAFNEAAEGVSDPIRGLKAVTMARGTLERNMARVIEPKQ